MTVTGQRRWWTTWWAIIPGLLLFLPLGLVGVWLRQGISNTAKSLVTIASVGLFGILIATAPPPEPTASPKADAAPGARTPGNTSAPRTHAPSPRATARQTPIAATVPALRGLSINQARHKLHRAGLKVGHVSRKPSRARPGTLLSQGVARGAQVRLGARVPLIVAIPLPKIPVVVGQSASSAIGELGRAGFKVVKRQRTVSTGREGVVLVQVPRGGVRTRPASVVTVVVAHVIPKRPLIRAPSCTSGYLPCLKPAPDYDCAGGSGDGPGYAYGPIRITGSDPYDLDRDGDGVACEE